MSEVSSTICRTRSPGTFRTTTRRRSEHLAGYREATEITSSARFLRRPGTQHRTTATPLASRLSALGVSSSSAALVDVAIFVSNPSADSMIPLQRIVAPFVAEGASNSLVCIRQHCGVRRHVVTPHPPSVSILSNPICH